MQIFKDFHDLNIWLHFTIFPEVSVARETDCFDKLRLI